MSNCLFEATLQEIEFRCNCTPKNFIQIAPNFKACTGEGKKCMVTLMESIGEVRYFFVKKKIVASR